MEENKISEHAMPEIKMDAEGEVPSPKNTLMATLSYIGPLVIIPFVTSKNDAFVFFHVKQGLVLFISEITLWFLMMLFWFLFPLLQVINIVIFVLAVIGIVHALQGKEKKLPWIGGYAEKFTF